MGEPNQLVVRADIANAVSLINVCSNVMQLLSVEDLKNEVESIRTAITTQTAVIEKLTKVTAKEAKIRGLQSALTNSAQGSFEYFSRYCSTQQGSQLESLWQSRDLVAFAVMAFLRGETLINPHGYVSSIRDVTEEEALAARALFHTKLCDHLHGLTGHRPSLRILDDERFELKYI